MLVVCHVKPRAMLIACSIAAFALSACDTQPTPNTPFPIASNSAVGGDPVPGGPCAGVQHKSVDEAIDAGVYSFAYGTIQSAVPVLDRFDWDPVSGETRASCRGDLEPALRITIKLSEASWDRDGEDTIVVGTLAGGWHRTAAEPHVKAGESSLSWSDGNRYFHPGDAIGVVGGFGEQGHFLVSATNFFTVDADGAIASFRESQCLDGTLNGQALSDVVARSYKAEDGQKPFFSPPLLSPLYSICTQ